MALHDWLLLTGLIGACTLYIVGPAGVCTRFLPWPLLSSRTVQSSGAQAVCKFEERTSACREAAEEVELRAQFLLFGHSWWFNFVTKFSL